MVDSTLAIVLVVVGALLFAAAVALTIYLVFCRRRRQYDEIPDAEGSLAQIISRNISQPAPAVKIDPEAETLSARMYLRSRQAYRLLKDAPVPVGCRLERSAFLVAPTRAGGADLLMTMTRRAPECQYVITESNKATFIAVLKKFTDDKVHPVHPYVMPVVDADYLPDRGVAVVFRRWVTRGSLRDLIYSAAPMQPFTRKYIRGHVLEPGLVALYGRQVLEGMRYLLSNGIPLGHIHTGNVLIDGGVPRITDWENTLLGLQPQPPRRMSDTDVLQFGALVYEMATGMPLCGPPQLEICPPPVRDLLQMIFDPTPAEPVTLDALAAAPLFAAVQLPPEATQARRISWSDDAVELLKKSKAERGPAGRRSLARRKRATHGSSRRDLASAGSESLATSAPSTSFMSAAASSTAQPVAAAAVAPPARRGPPPAPAPPVLDSVPVQPPPVDSSRGALLASIRDPSNARRLRHVDAP